MIDIEKRIRKIKWYDQGGEGKILYMSIPAHFAGYDMLKSYKYSYENFLCFSIDGRANFALDISALKKMYRYIIHKHMKDNNFLKNVFKIHEENERLLDTEMEKYGNLKRYSDDELIIKFKKFIKAWEKAWVPFIFVDSFDLFWEDILYEHSKSNLSDVDKIKILLQPDDFSYIQEEEIELLNIKKNYTYKKLMKHKKKYCWYKNNYGNVSELSFSHFKKKMKSLKEKDVIDFIKKKKKIKIKKKRILAEIKLSKDLKKFIDLMVGLTKGRDLRKRVNCKGQVIIKRIINEIARRRKINPELYENIPYPYIVDNLFTVSKNDINSNVCIFFNKGEKPIWFNGKNALELKKVYDKALEKESKEITGQVACKGNVKGKVKIIIKQDEFSKMNLLALKCEVSN